MYLTGRLRDIFDRLGPTLAELGLKMHLTGPDPEHYLFFQRTDAEGVVWRSPVSFIFLSQENSGMREPTWEGNTIWLGKGTSSIESIGTNGWIVYCGGYSQAAFEVGEDDDFKTWDDAFQEAEKRLRACPLVPETLGLPGILDDGVMASYWPMIEKICGEREIENVDVGRTCSSFEYYEFTYLESQFRLLFDHRDSVHLIVDGGERKTVNAYDRDILRDAVAEQLDRLEIIWADPLMP